MYPTNKVEAIIRFIEVAKQGEGQQVEKLIGVLDAENFCKLISHASLDANPRDSKISRVTDDIQESLEKSPELFHHKSKGLLVSCGNCEELERKRFRLSFSDPELEGILDGGHNTLAIGLFLVEAALGAEATKGIKRWKSFTDLWRERGQEVEEFCRANPTQFPFRIPLEVPYPSGDGGSIAEFHDAILEIAQARNNNSQLTEETKANKAGHYDFLREHLDPEISKQVEWRSNDGGRIKAREVVSLSLIPISFFYEEIVETSCNLVKIHSSKGQCVQEFNKLFEADGITEATNGGIKALVDDRVKSALKLMKDIPELYDEIYARFPDAYNANKGKFGRIDAVTQKPGKTKFYERATTNRYPEGFILPLVVGLTELIRRDGDTLEWRTDPRQFIRERLTEVVASYKAVIEMSGYDPQKVGKNAASYEIVRGAYKLALATSDIPK